jgi:signal transduction histidine kinase
MSRAITDPANLRPQELKAAYAISQAVSRAIDIETALDKIIHLVRPVFIFDNIALFEPGINQNLETVFAKAIGRGRSKEADLFWGEQSALLASKTGHTVAQLEAVGKDKVDRTNIHHSLALPLLVGGDVKGVLVFLRFGGPEYLPDQIHLAEFIAVHIAQLFEHRQLVQRIADLEAKRRLDTLQAEFTAMVSHELMTPLGFIKGYATTLLRQDINWEEETRREFLTIIDEESDRLSDLINNLMDSSRLQVGMLPMTFQVTRLDSLLKDVCLRAKSLNEDLSISFQILTPGIQIRADPTRLAQVFDNVLINATKYAPGSPVTITLDQVEDNVHIKIKDQGQGLSPEPLAQLFQRFYRAPEHRASTRGTGLGLYICRKIIEAHSGKIEVESALNEGMTFHIYLPFLSPS